MSRQARSNSLERRWLAAAIVSQKELETHITYGKSRRGKWRSLFLAAICQAQTLGATMVIYDPKGV